MGSARFVVTGVRWLLVIAAPLLGWYLALMAGVLLLSFVESLCPPEKMVSGICTASWFPFAEKAVFCSGSALAASLVVIGAFVPAPAWRREIAWSVFGLGSIVAVDMAWEGAAWAELVFALLAGALTSFFLTRGARAGVAPASREGS